MKTLTWFSFVTLFIGCASVDIPRYIPDHNPYKKKFYASFEDVLNVTQKTFQENGWKVASVTDPAIFERTKLVGSESGKQAVIFTEIRQTALVLGTRYARMNAFLRTGSDNSVELELRYVTVTSIPLKTFYNYRKDAFLERIFKQIEKNLHLTDLRKNNE